MKGEIIKIQKFNSKYGGECYLVVLRLENGKTNITYLDPQNRNFKRWKPFLKEGTVVEGLRLKGNLIDADSFVKPEKEFILAKIGAYG